MKAALVISDRDNVATALEALEPGRVLELNGRTITVAERIPPGHKVALMPIAVGEPVIKYGSSIGTAVAQITTGSHVHVHNVASGRGRGDVPLPSADAGPRLAEPPDDLNGLDRPPIRNSRRPA
jgi:altronate dehydratase small subunit